MSAVVAAQGEGCFIIFFCLLNLLSFLLSQIFTSVILSFIKGFVPAGKFKSTQDSLGLPFRLKNTVRDSPHHPHCKNDCYYSNHCNCSFPFLITIITSSNVLVVLVYTQ